MKQLWGVETRPSIHTTRLNAFMIESSSSKNFICIDTPGSDDPSGVVRSVQSAGVPLISYFLIVLPYFVQKSGVEMIEKLMHEVGKYNAPCLICFNQADRLLDGLMRDGGMSQEKAEIELEKHLVENTRRIESGLESHSSINWTCWFTALNPRGAVGQSGTIKGVDEVRFWLAFQIRLRSQVEVSEAWQVSDPGLFDDREKIDRWVDKLTGRVGRCLPVVTKHSRAQKHFELESIRMFLEASQNLDNNTEAIILFLSRLFEKRDNSSSDIAKLKEEAKEMVRQVKEILSNVDKDALPVHLQLLQRFLQEPEVTRFLVGIAGTKKLWGLEDAREAMTHYTSYRKLPDDAVLLGNLIGKGQNEVYEGTLRKVVLIHDQVDDYQYEVGSEVAVKRMISPVCDANFRRELVASSLLSSHPNIVTFLGVNQHYDGDKVCLDLVMERADGIFDDKLPCIKWRQRSSHLIDYEKLSLKERVKILFGVVLGLSHMHAHGVVHRDLKRLNVLLLGSPDHIERAMVCDFGEAKSTILSACSVGAGTWVYWAPESLDLEADHADPRVDMYSFGYLMFELLKGTTILREIEDGGEEKFPLVFPMDSFLRSKWADHLKTNHREPVPLEGVEDLVLRNLVGRCWADERISSEDMCSALRGWLQQDKGKQRE